MSKKATKVVLNRNFILSSTKGHTIEFVKDQPVHIPPALYSEVLALGAVAVDGEISIGDDSDSKQKYVDPDQRPSLVYAAIDHIVTKNERDDFTAAGAPTVKAVQQIVGFKITSDEIAVAWQEYHQNNADKK